MNAKEFIKIAYNGGYALKKNAQKKCNIRY